METLLAGLGRKEEDTWVVRISSTQFAVCVGPLGHTFGTFVCTWTKQTASIAAEDAPNDGSTSPETAEDAPNDGSTSPENKAFSS
jgi:hypothetical protein